MKAPPHDPTSAGAVLCRGAAFGAAGGVDEAALNRDGHLDADEDLAALVTEFAVRDLDRDGLPTLDELRRRIDALEKQASR